MPRVMWRGLLFVLALTLVAAPGLRVTGPQSGSRDDAGASGAGFHPMAHAAAAPQGALSADVVAKISQARLATAKYAMDLERAKADGYMMITPMIPNMGYHLLNPKIEGFDVTKPPILVYVRKGDVSQLVAIEWVFPKKPAAAPLNGARYGSFDAACHYKDGSFVVAGSQAKCGKTNTTTGADFTFWHPPLVTLHLWIWYPNPNGVFGEFNPLLTPFNKD
ncbi:MAG: hypothetical protein ACT4P5_16845 [Armatimonadota bacterium]